MKRMLTFALALVLLLGCLPMGAGAMEIDAAEIGAMEADAVELDGEDPILDYGAFLDSDGTAAALMGSASGQSYGLADIPEGESYVNMSTSQEMIDIIKDFEGFRSTPYWDNNQWTVGYGTRCSDPNILVTEDEAEQMLRKALKSDYEVTVNNFCKKNGKQPTQQQFDAMLDLTYNNGGSWTTGSSVPDAVLNDSTALEIVQGFGAWSRSAGKVSYVHVNRRIREALIYLYGEYYRAYGNQDCKSDIEVISDDDLPHFKVVIFKTNYGSLPNGKTDYAAYYPVDTYYGSFLDATRSGYTLMGWEITKRSNDSVDGGKISIYDKVSENLELTAMWEYGDVEVPPDVPPADYVDPSTPVLPFTDVTEDSWFYEPVKYVYENGLMNGISGTEFDPSGEMTRGMLVAVLYRMDGSPAVVEEDRGGFTDIQGAYYTDAIDWAYANGIVKGVDSTTFAPDRVITRQEAVTIFHRFCVEYKQVADGAEAELCDYLDAGDVAPFAEKAFAWAVGTGLVEGSADADGLRLNPESTLNRVQAAILLMRCAEELL